MDMSKHSGAPWLDQPVMLHSSRESGPCKLTPEQCAYKSYRWRNWYIADHVYALGTIYFLCATLGVFVISHFLNKYAPSSLKKSRLWRKAEAVARYVAYKGFQLPALRYWSPSLGVILLLLAGVVFFFAMTLGPKPYYWPDPGVVKYGGSPPIATRSGWMALALLPFGMAISAKANLISALTGVSHEKLQIFHQWIGYAMFVLALIHTFPFIVYNIRVGDMVMQWDTQVTYWTGVVALLAQAYLTFLSIPVIRKRFYETFKATHLLAALVFILFFFFHCDFRLSSWDYFIATGSIYMFSLFAAQFRTYCMHGVHEASLDVLPSGFVRVKIPTITSWRSGQHIFIRFFALGLHSLTSHPFTIASTYRDPERLGKAPEMILTIQPRGGITARLAKLAAKSPGITKKVLLEGPYGGLPTTAPNLGHLDTVLVISGGSGATFSLPIIEETLHRRLVLPSSPATRTSCCAPEPSSCKKLQVVFATRSAAVARWYIEEVETLFSTYGASNESSAAVYITQSQEQQKSTRLSSSLDEPPESTAELADKEINHTEDSTSPPSSSHYNIILHKLVRPNLPSIITGATSAERGSGNRIGVFVCGPESMLHDTRNSAAEAQARVLSGEVDEVYLHSEPFSW